MSFLSWAIKNRKLLWALKDLGKLVKEAEQLLGPGYGPEKKARVMSVFYDSLVMAEKGSGKELVNENEAREAAGLFVDATVKMFNAFGLWYEFT